MNRRRDQLQSHFQGQPQLQQPAFISFEEGVSEFRICSSCGFKNVIAGFFQQYRVPHVMSDHRGQT